MKYLSKQGRRVSLNVTPELQYCRWEALRKTLSPSAQCPAVTQIHTHIQPMQSYTRSSLFALLVSRHCSGQRSATHTRTHTGVVERVGDKQFRLGKSKELENLFWHSWPRSNWTCISVKCFLSASVKHKATEDENVFIFFSVNTDNIILQKPKLEIPQYCIVPAATHSWSVKTLHCCTQMRFNWKPLALMLRWALKGEH